MIDINNIARRLDVASTVVIDTETSGLDWRHDVVVGWVLTFSADPKDSFYLPIRHLGGGNLNVNSVEGMIANKFNSRRSLRVIGHNLGFDLMFSRRHGVAYHGPLEDTMINSFLIDERQNSFSLDACCKFMKVQEKKGDALYAHLASKFGGQPVRTQMANFWKLAGDDPLAVDYAVGDGTSTWQLWEKQQSELDAQNLRDIWSVECRVIRVLHHMMWRGVKIDENRLEQVTKTVKRQLELAHSKLPKDFNEKAPSQLKEYFIRANTTNWPLTEKGNPSFPEEWLLTTEPGRNIVAARKLRHLDNSFLTPLKKHHLFKGRVHTTYNQTRGEEFGTVTGRLSSSNPNLQQVHKRNKELGALFRSIFVPDDGMKWGSADYSQIEPRLLAHYAQCKVLLNGYRADPPIDAHSAVAKAANIDRESGKRLNQALITGAGNRKAAMMLNRPMDEAMRIVGAYFASMPEIKKLQSRASNVLLTRGYIRSLGGRRARLDDPRFAYRAVNRLLQCSNADILKRALADIGEYLMAQGDSVHLLNNVHDALDYQFPDGQRQQYEHALKTMCEVAGPDKPYNMSVPLTIEVDEGDNWAEATWGRVAVKETFDRMETKYDA